jgi:hypothetical protein
MAKLRRGVRAKLLSPPEMQQRVAVGRFAGQHDVFDACESCWRARWKRPELVGVFIGEAQTTYTSVKWMTLAAGAKSKW